MTEGDCLGLYLTSYVVPRPVLFLFPSMQTSTSAATLAPALMANVKTNLAASSASPASLATAARGAGPAVVRADLTLPRVGVGGLLKVEFLP